MTLAWPVSGSKLIEPTPETTETNFPISNFRRFALRLLNRTARSVFFGLPSFGIFASASEIVSILPFSKSTSLAANPWRH